MEDEKVKYLTALMLRFWSIKYNIDEIVPHVALLSSQ